MFSMKLRNRVRSEFTQEKNLPLLKSIFCHFFFLKSQAARRLKGEFLSDRSLGCVRQITKSEQISAERTPFPGDDVLLWSKRVWFFYLQLVLCWALRPNEPDFWKYATRCQSLAVGFRWKRETRVVEKLLPRRWKWNGSGSESKQKADAGDAEKPFRKAYSFSCFTSHQFHGGFEESRREKFPRMQSLWWIPFSPPGE